MGVTQLPRDQRWSIGRLVERTIDRVRRRTKVDVVHANDPASDSEQPERAPAMVTYVFTSNVRTRYRNDAIAVTSLPTGAHIRFRYKRQYVSEQLRSDWASGALRGTPFLALFSVQHPQQLHEAYYIPLRHGTVASTEVEGTSFLIDLKLGEYQPSGSDDSGPGSAVRDLRHRMNALLGDERPDTGVSAVRAEPVPMDLPEDASSDWEAVVNTLDASGEFKDLRHYRVASITRPDGSKISPDERGRFPLEDNSVYVMRIVHHQPGEVEDAQTLTVASLDEDVLEVVSGSSIEVSSRYDAHDVTLRTGEVERAHHLAVLVGASDGKCAVPIEIPVTVRVRRTRRALKRSVAPAAGGSLLAVPGLVALDDPWGWPLVAVAAGALTWGILGYFGAEPFSLT